MRLILDTNILVSALIKKSLTWEILIHPEIEYVVSEFVFEEIELNKQEILRKSELSEEEFEILFENLKDRLIFMPDEKIMHKDKALKVMHKIDINDSIFIALALSTENDGIWSQDKHFELQNIVKVWKTKDIVNYLSIHHE